ncbi:MAG: hypothetical protein ABFR50_02660 [Candidatus Fermentibacteria bacterium]
MNKNVKVIASLVRKAKKKLLQNKREEALDLMKKAVITDDNKGVLIQVIQAIGRKTLITEPEDQPARTQEAPVFKRVEPELLVTPEVPALEQAEPEQLEDTEEITAIEEDPIEMLDKAWEMEEQSEDDEIEILDEAWEVEEQSEDDEIEILDETWAMEEQFVETSEPDAIVMESNQERIPSMPSEEQLYRLFEASDREYEKGHQQKALAYLKRAGNLFPDNPEILSRIDLLKLKIKSANLVQIASKRLALGEITRAVSLARQAFDLSPDSAGLDELLSDLEDLSETSSSTPRTIEPQETRSGASAEYIARIRQLVQDNSLEEAASVAAEAFIFFPEDDLVVEFVDNFKKLGLLE